MSPDPGLDQELLPHAQSIQSRDPTNIKSEYRAFQETTYELYLQSRDKLRGFLPDYLEIRVRPTSCTLQHLRNVSPIFFKELSPFFYRLNCVIQLPGSKFCTDVRQVMRDIARVKADCFCRQWGDRANVLSPALRRCNKRLIFPVLCILNWLHTSFYLCLLKVSSFSYHARMRQFLQTLFEFSLSTTDGRNSNMVYIFMTDRSSLTYIGQTNRSYEERYLREHSKGIQGFLEHELPGYAVLRRNKIAEAETF